MVKAENILTPSQCRAARGLIDISQDGLAELAEISGASIHHFESQKRNPGILQLIAVRSALEVEGVFFVFEEGIGCGVLLRRQKLGFDPQMNRSDPRRFFQNGPQIMVPAQCRAGRGLLNMSQAELSSQSRVSRETIANFEGENNRVRDTKLSALRAHLEARGVLFIAEQDGSLGVRLRSSSS